MQLSPSKDEELDVAPGKCKLLGDIQLSPSKDEELDVVPGKCKLLGDIQLSPSKDEELDVAPGKCKLLGDMQLSPSKDEELGVAPGKCKLLGDIQLSPSKDEELGTPNKKRRHKGEGSGSIYWRVVRKNGKDYAQAYYQFEFWQQGECYVKTSKYIPKRLLADVEELDKKKAPVKEVLRVLGVLK
jgi:hypothetical protein